MAKSKTDEVLDAPMTTQELLERTQAIEREKEQKKRAREEKKLEKERKLRQQKIEKLVAPVLLVLTILIGAAIRFFNSK